MKVNYYGARKDKGKHKCVFCMVVYHYYFHLTNIFNTKTKVIILNETNCSALFLNPKVH